MQPVLPIVAFSSIMIFTSRQSPVPSVVVFSLVLLIIQILIDDISQPWIGCTYAFGFTLGHSVLNVRHQRIMLHKEKLKDFTQEHPRDNNCSAVDEPIASSVRQKRFKNRREMILAALKMSIIPSFSYPCNVNAIFLSFSSLSPSPLPTSSSLLVSSTKSGPKSGSTSETYPSMMDPELSAAAQRLFDLDMNRLVPGRDYEIDVQSAKQSPSQKDDAAPERLFRFVDPAVFERPTFRTFVALLNNYDANPCAIEDSSDAKQSEAMIFLRATMATPVMQFCYQYCKMKLPTLENNKSSKLILDSDEDFLRLLYKIWFKMYRRCDRESEAADVVGSSGFEHVFVGEIKNGKVAGFHNWIQIYLEERQGHVDYRGSIGSFTPSPNTRILTYQLRWNGFDKYVGTSFIGVSPEFELALYTMMFVIGKQDNVITLNIGGDERVNLDVKCYKIAKGKVGSCFVELLPPS